jgi:putative glutamine amidotransferase
MSAQPSSTRSRPRARRPVILITASTQKQGVEFGDASLSLSDRYIQAVLAGGGLPLIAPFVTSPEEVTALLRTVDGLLLTGGDDLEPTLYTRSLPPALARTVGREHPRRDLLECLLVDELFRQRKPLLAICRGHQLLNVALGGDLIVDIPQQVPGCLAHKRMDLKNDPVHDVALAPGSLAARLATATTLGVNSSHHQAVGRVCGLLRATAASADGVVEAMELQPEHLGALPWLLSVQWHPERLFDRHTEHLAIFSAFVKACAAPQKT